MGKSSPRKYYDAKNKTRTLILQHENYVVVFLVTSEEISILIVSSYNSKPGITLVQYYTVNINLIVIRALYLDGSYEHSLGNLVLVILPTNDYHCVG